MSMEVFSAAFHALHPGAVMSGLPVSADFLRGWAAAPFIGRMAHFFVWDGHEMTVQDVPTKRVVRGYKTFCGRETVSTYEVPLLGPGNMPRCGHCQRAELVRSKHRLP